MRMFRRQRKTMQDKRDELPPDEEERKRTLAWLARYGERIADAMFRDAGLFYEEELQKQKEGNNICT